MLGCLKKKPKKTPTQVIPEIWVVGFFLIVTLLNLDSSVYILTNIHVYVLGSEVVKNAYS